MISRDEFLEQAKVYDLNEADIQRYYVFGWLIPHRDVRPDGSAAQGPDLGFEFRNPIRLT